MQRFHNFATFMAVLAWFTAASNAWASDADLEQRLGALVKRMEDRRVALHVPGMSLVVVKNGEIVLARGFGVTDFDSRTPITADTVFMIGSTTKAFTATLVGMLVDEGKLAWDEPIATVLPYFDPRVQSDDPDAHVTLRDALSHRSGFSRMSVLLAARNMPARDVLEVANRAEPYDDFRAAFHYNNIMYLAAGTATAEAAGGDWHKLLRKRLLKPLDMKQTTSISTKTAKTLVPGYAWVEDLGEHDRQPVLAIDVVAPAGSIVSNANDMGRWLRFLLARGTIDGTRLIAAGIIEETWKPNVEIADGIGYGMGWMTRRWEGQRILEHGGNINGFAAQVGLAPDADLGFALLTNLSATPLQQESLTMVWEELLGANDSDGDGDRAAGETLARFLGEFVANFGPFVDSTFTVTESDGALFVDVPGQTNYELKPPGEDGRRPFAITDTIAVSFESNDDGDIDMMRMHQGGLDFEIPRRGATFPVELDPVEFEPFLGKYKSNVFQTDVTVLVRNDRLAIDVPGQLAFELRLPDEAGRRRFRIRDVMSATFETGERGTIDTMVLRRGDEVVDTMPRIADPDTQPLPTVDALMAVRATAARRAAIDALGVVRTSGTFHFVNAGLGGRSVQWADGKRFRSDAHFGKFGWQRTALTPETGWTLTNVTPLDEITGRRLRAMYQTQQMIQTLDWRDAFETVRVLKREELDGHPVIRVRLENADSPGMSVYVDPATGDVRRIDAVLPIPGANADLPLTVQLEDYRDVAGIRVPFRTITDNAETGRTVLEIEDFQALATSCDRLMTLTDTTPCAGFERPR